jgi:hypothetical protein
MPSAFRGYRRQIYKGAGVNPSIQQPLGSVSADFESQLTSGGMGRLSNVTPIVPNNVETNLAPPMSGAGVKKHKPKNISFSF